MSSSGTDASTQSWPFLAGGGEMGSLTRSFDWSRTPLGSPGQWPQSLRTAVSIVLGSRFPMFLFWGTDLICFYNDAYRSSLGDGDNSKHPRALGAPGAEIWPEIWPVIKPQIDQVLEKGEATWLENGTDSFYRNGRLEAGTWTYSYSPVRGENGDVAGVFVTCLETTGAMQQQEAAKQSEHRFRSLVENAPTPICIFKGEDLILETANKPLLDTWQTDASAIGKPLIDILPEMHNQPIIPWLQRVYREGITLRLPETSARFERRNGNTETSYFDFVFLPYRDGGDAVSGVMAMATEVTSYVLGRQREEKARMRLLSLFDQSPVGLAIISRDKLSYTSANAFYSNLVGREPVDIIGKPLYEALPELQDSGIDVLLRNVLDTGVSYNAEEAAFELQRGGQKETLYFNFAYQPLRDEVGNINEVLVIAIDITAQVVSRKKIEESEARFRSLFEEAPVATCLFVGRELRVETANAPMLEIWGKGEDVLGKTFAEVLPELEDQPFLKILDEVYTTGVTYSATNTAARLVKNGVSGTFYFNFIYKPLRNEAGAVYAIMQMASDVTEQVTVQQKLAQSEAKLRGIVSTAPVAIGLFVGRDLIIENPNQTFIDIVGKGWGVEGLPLREAMPELITEGQPFLRILDDVFTTGVPFTSPASLVKIVQDGVLNDNYYNISYTPLRNASGEIYAILDVAVDVTELVRARKLVEEKEKALQSAIELAEMGTWTIDLVTGAVSMSQKMADMVGVEPAGLTYEQAFAMIHPEEREQAQAMFLSATDDGSSGKYEVRCRIINARTGRLQIVHVQGETTFGATGRPLFISGTARDVTAQQEIQTALENEVQQRTEELASALEELKSANEELEESNEQLLHSNEELAQYAYVASHDLQEPLRKIQVFSGILAGKQDLSEAGKVTIAKIQGSAERMSMLIKDLLTFSRLLKSDTLMRPVDLNATAAAVWNDFELMAAEKSATISIGTLPAVQAVNLQMNQLFYNLIGNALKFSAADRAPHIDISSEPIAAAEAAPFVKTLLPFSNYHRIRITDNGIGFETQYQEQIFEVFKRLHGRDSYPGSGIGLALCRRIVGNHNGGLFAESTPGEGSRFTLILPERQRDENSIYEGQPPMNFGNA